MKYCNECNEPTFFNELKVCDGDKSWHIECYKNMLKRKRNGAKKDKK